MTPTNAPGRIYLQVGDDARDLTDADIEDIFQSVANDDPDVVVRFARAVLRAAQHHKPVEPTHQGTASLSYPTADDTSDPVFVAIWQTIRGWNLERTRGAELAWANGMDAFAILQAVRASLSGAQQGEATWPAGLAGWKVERKQDILGTIIVKAPNGFSAVVSKVDRNPANVLYMLADALFDAAAPAQPAPGGEDRRDVLAAIAAERQRQVAVEGWTPGHDDEHTHGELASAAAVYALATTGINARRYWPWHESGWLKPTSPRRNLVKAAALIVAEIERRDRTAMSPPPTSGTSRPFTPEEHAAWERENGVGEA